MTTERILLGAAAEIRKGFVKGTRHSDAGCCALGAMENAYFNGKRPTNFIEAIRPDVVEQFAMLVPPLPIKKTASWSDAQFSAHRIAVWNNAPERTAEEVAQMFERAAKRQPMKHKQEETVAMPVPVG